MKVVRIHEDGGPEVLRYEDVDEPVAGEGEVLVRLKAASLNHLDIWTRQGMPSVPKPRILGADGAGVVEAVGEHTDGFAVGDEVVLNPGLEDGAHILGEHQDAVVAGDWLRDHASGRAAFVAGELVATERAAARSARDEWPSVWAKARRKRLRRFMQPA